MLGDRRREDGGSACIQAQLACRSAEVRKRRSIDERLGILARNVRTEILKDHPEKKEKSWALWGSRDDVVFTTLTRYALERTSGRTLKI